MKTVTIDGQPVAPSKIVCIGQNYVAHIEELGNEIPDHMVVFAKPNSAIDSVLRAVIDEPVHYESELCFAVRDGQFHAVGFGLDLTRRALQTRLRSKGLPWERAKAFDGAAVFSELVPYGAIEDLSLTLTIDGKTAQTGGYDLMMYKPAAILDELKRFMTLEDGDIVMTGTPKGVGPLVAGAEYEGSVLDGDRRIVSARWRAV